MPNFTAKKSLGQHFLHAPNVVGAMIHTARIEPGMIVLEIGPGKGILTRGLLKAGAKVMAVEKDQRAVEYMKENFVTEIADGRLKLVQDDILVINPADLGLEKEKYVIAANIPYYITGEIIRKFLTAEVYPSRMVLLVQKEVAKRIVAADKKESILSISVKAYGEPKYIDTVPKRFFRPIPKVDSAIILIDKISKKFFENERGDSSVTPAKAVILSDSGISSVGSNKRNLELGELQDPVGMIEHNQAKPRNLLIRLLGGDDKKSEDNKGIRGNDKIKCNESYQINEKLFFDVIKAGFAHKRKVVRGNLAKIIPAQALERLWKEKRWPVNVRAENFTLEQWGELVSNLKN
jgi:16S rRNA (adenine1518-N6/adenine1519-N6)-dimethyltransferase